jgi:hypothetical protein
MSVNQGNWFTNQKEVDAKIQNIAADGGSFTGDVTGDLTGNVTGDVTGDTTGTHIGAVTNTSGLVQTKQLELVPVEYTGDGIVDPNNSFFFLNGATTGVDRTIAAPEVGAIVVCSCNNATNNCTLKLLSGTFDGTNNTATFNAAEETLVFFGLSTTRAVILENIGGVVLSST